MESIKELFYQALQDDYRASRPKSDSVIYQFLKKERERQLRQFQALSSQKKASIKLKEPKLPYPAQLQNHFEALLAGTETPEQYISNLFCILGKGRIPCQEASGKTISILDDLLERETDPECLGLPRLKKLKELAARLESGNTDFLEKVSKTSYAQKPYQELRILTEGLLDCATKKSVKDFFYDAGYPYRETEPDEEYGTLKNVSYREKQNPSASFTKRQANAKNKREPRVDKTLNLLAAYNERHPGRLFQAPTVSKEDCEKLFRQLFRGNNQEVLVPLRVDPLTGCALYIIGKSYYEPFYEEASGLKKERFKKSPGACAYGILKLIDDSWTGASVGYLLSDWFNFYGEKGINNIDEALDAYKDACQATENDLKDYNQTLPPGCPSVLLQFSHSVPKRLTPDELEMARLAEQKEFEEFEKSQR